ncbi:uncharacterized protein LOC126902630 isoform X2 [Daktulosphaira vitifoliae]|uniref:uncharacterized protein LOC126902630 isoform X2 n=1 Tax=Daktulosphaira vitifoliae TaxID=58002 RepID=UPI0021AAD041|nr:uncharacterized protein LOC126902630 isoform X2 [Daktulosphaira vitifoliae]
MFLKIGFVICFASVAFGFPKSDDQNELVHTVLNSMSNVGRELSKVISDDSDKYSVDFNGLYKKYEVDNKAEDAKKFLQNQFKTGTEAFNQQIKNIDMTYENELKKISDMIKKDDPALGEKFNKYYDLTCQLDRLTEDIIKHTLSSEKMTSTFEKVKKDAFEPMQRKLIESIKKLEY